jgi:hypothetical protein
MFQTTNQTNIVKESQNPHRNIFLLPWSDATSLADQMPAGTMSSLWFRPTWFKTHVLQINIIIYI